MEKWKLHKFEWIFHGHYIGHCDQRLDPTS